jgi:hypothetical protein
MPFTTEQFLRVFESYNLTIYPAQWTLIVLASIAIFFAARTRSYSSRLIAVLLALLWAWTGIAYHLAFFTRINKAAYLFGLLFVAQAAIFLFDGLKGKLVFRAKCDRFGLVGGLIIVFALLIYPTLGFLSGHTYPRSPTFGTPCPLTMFTFGLLLWACGRVPLRVLIIPFVWSLMGISAAFFLGMREDVWLFVAGVAGTLLVASRNIAQKNAGASKLTPTA